ncbi:hypothetical protein COCCADRAFT_112016 [Bipolaris zeicola 26-R-13]|uniref:Uncharacterized protein n=1 Tax=Cochliobolus carbonum (strain 26-R-13) TaxID=930089 RepID=W6XX55_COCC2|nr:uncharacterized protein COCCADRAFT_112016 [Bipolaris zeicola 26-R-13]EUC27319.1 hypothetical protein COCCADRAFT_112016 [Bipolaris zeicola 26-R-13]
MQHQQTRVCASLGVLGTSISWRLVLTKTRRSRVKLLFSLDTDRAVTGSENSESACEGIAR